MSHDVAREKIYQPIRTNGEDIAHTCFEIRTSVTHGSHLNPDPFRGVSGAISW